MKRINSLLSVEKHCESFYKGTFRNGNKKADVLIPRIVPYNKLTFSEFFNYCIGQYEIYICTERSKEKFMKLFNDNNNFNKEDLNSFYEEVEDISLKLEKVYGENLKYFVSNLCSSSKSICGKEFETIKAKKQFLMDNIKF